MVVRQDVLVHAEVWHWVVKFVAERLLLVLVLRAAGRGTDWIGLEVQVSLRLHVRHLVTQLLLSGIGVSQAILDVLVGAEVRHKIVTWRVRRWWSVCVFPFAELLLSFGSARETLLNVVVLPEMWHKVITWWLTWLGETGSHAVTVLALGSGKI